MRTKLQEIQIIFSSASIIGERGKTPREKAERLFHYLMGRQNQGYSFVDTVPALPMYSLLAENIAHDLSLSMYYYDLCETAGIQCHIVKGSKNGSTYYWNILELEDRTIHVDLRRCAEQGIQNLIPLYDEDLEAEAYVWDRKIYPEAPNPQPPTEESTGTTETDIPKETDNSQETAETESAEGETVA
jgi:hypothetical protein